MNSDLLPCPFCGSLVIDNIGFWNHILQCRACGARSKPCSTYHKAVELWNSRYLSQAQVHADELHEALGYVLHQLKDAFLGNQDIHIDAAKLLALYNSCADIL